MKRTEEVSGQFPEKRLAEGAMNPLPRGPSRAFIAVALALVCVFAARPAAAHVVVLLDVTEPKGQFWVQLTSTKAIDVAFWTHHPKHAGEKEAIKALFDKWIEDTGDRRFASWDDAVEAAVRELHGVRPPTLKLVKHDVPLKPTTPEAILEAARQIVVTRFNTLEPRPHWLDQLASADLHTFVHVMSGSEIATSLRQKGFINTTGVIHFTDTWGNLKITGVPMVNPRQIYLNKDKLTVGGVAHELVHWLSHPAWKMYEGDAAINEGITEGFWHDIADKGDRNAVYDTYVGKFSGIVGHNAYFNGVDVSKYQKYLAAMK